MYSRTLGLQVAAAIFALISLLQLMRLATGFDVLVAGHAMPLWPNFVAFLVAAGLSWWMYKLSRSVAQ